MKQLRVFLLPPGWDASPSHIHTYLTKNPLPYFFQKSFSISWTDIFLLATIDNHASQKNNRLSEIRFTVLSVPYNNTWTLLSLQASCLALQSISHLRFTSVGFKDQCLWILADSGQFFFQPISHTTFTCKKFWLNEVALGKQKSNKGFWLLDERQFDCSFSLPGVKENVRHVCKKLPNDNDLNLTEKCPNTIFLTDVVRSCTKAFFPTKRYAPSIH